MQLVTVATDRIQAVDEWELLAKNHGFEPIILGEGLKWDGFGTYQRLLRDFFASYQGPSSDLIATVDCYDLLAAGAAEELERKFHGFNVPIVVGGEETCAQNCFRHTQPVNHDTYKWVNSGMIVGSVYALQSLFQWCYENFPDDDQVAIGNYMENFPGRVAIDGKQSLVANVYSLDEIAWNGARYQHAITGEYPIFLHTPFIAKDLGRRNEAIRGNLVKNYTPSSTLSYTIDLGRHITKHAKTNPVYTPLVVAGVIILAIVLILIAVALLMLPFGRHEARARGH